MKKAPLLFLFCPIITITLFAQPYRFQNYTEKNGFCCTPVTSICKDKKGYLWVSSTGGLNRFDGFKFKQFTRQPGDSNSLQGGDVRNLEVDNKGRYWINDGYLGILNPNTGLITHCMNPVTGKKIFIWQMLLYDSSQLFIADDKMLAWYDMNSGKVTGIKKLSGITQLVKEKDGLVWATHSNGLCAYNPATRRFVFESKPFGITGNTTTSIRDRYGNIWLTQWNNGFYKINPRTSEVRHFTNRKEKPSDMLLPFIDNTFTRIIELDNGHLWVCDYNTAIVDFDPVTEKYFNIVHDPGNPHSIPKERFYQISKDDEGIIWIGGSAGFSKMDPAFQYFDTRQLGILKGGGAGGEILSVLNDTQGNTWFGTYTGLFAYNRQTAKTVYINPQVSYMKKNFAEEAIYSMAADGKGGLFLGGHMVTHITHIANKPGGGLSFRWDTIPQPPDRFGGVFSMVVNSNSLWMGTSNRGLLQYNLATKKYEIYSRSANGTTLLPQAQVFSLFADNKGQMWVGTPKGLAVLDTATGKITREYFDGNRKPDENNSAFVNSIVQDNDGLIWVGTRYNGLWMQQHSGRWQPANHLRTFEPLCIWKILKARDGMFWMNTGSGLCLFDPKTGYSRILKQEDGLINTPELGDMDFCSDGSLALADQAAMHYINTSLIGFTPKKPLPHIVDVYAYDEQLAFEENSRITLPYSKNQLRFEYAGILFDGGENVKYQYLLEGFDKQWNNADGRRYATYTNLPEGHYTFKVKATNGYGQGNNEVATLQVHILTPWFRSWWFYLLCLQAGAAIIYAIYRYRLAQVHKMYQMRNSIAADLHDEIGSTLSSISMSSQLAEKQVANEMSTRLVLQQITTNSQQMLESMTDIVWSINPANDRLESTLIRMRQFAAELLEPQHILVNFEVEKDMERILLHMVQRKNLYLIFKEAINNTSKHACCKKVSVFLALKGKKLLMQISDDGGGFALDMQTNFGGNGLHNMKQRAKDLGGTLQIDSTVEKGVTITLHIPINATS
jgi:ligand-binding sensor domain-containing protein/two-component sensor histidine kinase